MARTSPRDLERPSLAAKQLDPCYLEDVSRAFVTTPTFEYLLQLVELSALEFAAQERRFNEEAQLGEAGLVRAHLEPLAWGDELQSVHRGDVIQA
ncbi:hypothetical protein EYF80_057401 [Liparis tanakae]|uniref:Uncharacterized protein n=1 Tax=Liparis tanakae TaxID=230148 RepID=A0A4Z2EUW3_9TELE|nr:hypothetical protein EYF80_057401 [Liparis tanakae]